MELHRAHLSSFQAVAQTFHVVGSAKDMQMKTPEGSVLVYEVSITQIGARPHIEHKPSHWVCGMWCCARMDPTASMLVPLLSMTQTPAKNLVQNLLSKSPGTGLGSHILYV